MSFRENKRKPATQPNDDVENHRSGFNSRGETISGQYEAGLSRIYTNDTLIYEIFLSHSHATDSTILSHESHSNRRYSLTRQYEGKTGQDKRSKETILYCTAHMRPNEY